MFDFQKLEVYKKAKEFNIRTTKLIAQSKFDSVTNDQLRRASFSIMLNIAEGSARFTKKDKRHFMVISRGSAFECLSIMEYLVDTNQISKEVYDKVFNRIEEISKMLFGLIKSLS